MKRPDIAQELLAAKGKDFVTQWLPVKGKGDIVTDMGRFVSEELVGFPLKAVRLASITKTASKVSGDWLTLLYIGAVTVVFIMPYFLLRGVWWQLRRAAKSAVLLLRGKITYKAKVKDES